MSEPTPSSKLPMLIFAVSVATLLPIGVTTSLKKYNALKASQTTKESLRELENREQDAQKLLQEYSLQQAESEKGEKGDREKKLRAAEVQAEEARRLAEQERERILSQSQKLTPWTSDIHIIMQVIVSIVLLSATLFIVLSKKYNPTDKHWAYATLGLIIGFWLKT
jgi:hypothetical protein